MTNLLDKKGLSALLGISPRTIDRLRAAGQLRAVKLGSGKRAAVRFEVAEAERVVNQHREQQASTHPRRPDEGSV